MPWEEHSAGAGWLWANPQGPKFPTCTGRGVGLEQHFSNLLYLQRSLSTAVGRTQYLRHVDGVSMRGPGHLGSAPHCPQSQAPSLRGAVGNA